MYVEIIDAATGELVLTIPIVPADPRHVPTEQDCFDLAWHEAVADHTLDHLTVDAARRDDYRFRLASGGD